MPDGAIITLAAIAVIALAASIVVAARARNRSARVRTETAELRARVAEIAAMAGGLAHEIKNPLSTIGLNAQLLDEAVADLPIDEQERGRITRRLGTLTRETERLKGILEDFLEYAGEIRLHRATAPLAPIIDELCDFFLPEAEKRGVRLRPDLPPVPVHASIDAPLLKQAILNLLINASQALETVEPGAPRELIVRLNPGPTPSLSVIDTGPGMTDEQAARAFEPYFTTKSGGTGLGLPTTRRIIEAHGGTLTFNSQPGKGTAFTIPLPAAQPAGPNTDDRQAATE